METIVNILFVLSIPVIICALLVIAFAFGSWLDNHEEVSFWLAVGVGVCGVAAFILKVTGVY